MSSRAILSSAIFSGKKGGFKRKKGRKDEGRKEEKKKRRQKERKKGRTEERKIGRTEERIERIKKIKRNIGR